MLQRHICCILGKRLLMALISTTGCSQVAAFANPEPVRLDVRRNRPRDEAAARHWRFWLMG